jgi:hypothetical protein
MVVIAISVEHQQDPKNMTKRTISSLIIKLRNQSVILANYIARSAVMKNIIFRRYLAVISCMRETHEAHPYF